MPYDPTMAKYRFVPTLLLAALAPLGLLAGAEPPASAPEPAKSASAGEPGQPTAAEKPADSAKPTEAGKSAEPEKPAEPAGPTEAEKTLDAAITKIGALKSVSAEISQKVEMLNQHFEIKGKYLKGENNRLYLLLSVVGLPESKGDNPAGKSLQVCDGEILWDFQQVLEAQRYSKLRIMPILKKLQSPEIDPEFRVQVVNQLNLAGPDVLLGGLRGTIRFDQKEESELDHKKVWILRGNWKKRDGLLGPNQQPVAPNGPLPPYVPSLASLWIDQETGWPYKLELVGQARSVLQDTRRIGPDGRPIGAKNSIDKIDPTHITLVYSEVKLNPELKAEEFAWQAPPSVRVEDQTEAILTGLEQHIQMKVAQKKSEAAAKTEPSDDTLNQAIEVPKPGAPAPDSLPK